MDYAFTIVFICGGGYDYFHEILENNIHVLCDNTKESYDLVMFLDGIDNYDYEPYIKLAKKCHIDEVILRSRKNNCATGDPSNNAHMHGFSTKTKYLVTIESDVAIFKIQKDFDILHQIRKTFEMNQNLHLLTRIDDYECWKEKLVFMPKNLCKGIYSVNRVSSHFLIYDTHRCRKIFEKSLYSLYEFYDDENEWYNYEDMISKLFIYPKGPGIGFLYSFPIRVFHCDEKKYPGSAFYKRDTVTKLRVFEQRKWETLDLRNLYEVRSINNDE